MAIPNTLLHDSSYCDTFPKSENIHSLEKLVKNYFLPAVKTHSSIDKIHFEGYYNII